MNPLWTDTHCHLCHPRFAEDADQVLERALQAGVSQLIEVGYSEETCPLVLLLAERRPDVIRAAVGIHPHEAAHWNDDLRARLQGWLSHPMVCALGEIGLDYYYDFATPAQQQLVCRVQLAMARHRGLPVLLHCRDAWDDLLGLLESEAAGLHGVLHCFTGSVDQAQRAVAMGWLLGIGGLVTFKKPGALPDVVRAVGAEHLVLETDAPWMTPEPRRGRRNEPALLLHTASRVAELLDMPLPRLADVIRSNVNRLLTPQILTETLT